MKRGILLIASLGLALAYAGPSQAKSIKSDIPRQAVNAFCADAGLGEKTASFTAPSGTVITGTIDCEVEDTVATADDHGQQVEPGDDHGQTSEVGDDHGGHDDEVGDDDGGDNGNSGPGGGDDDGAGHDGGDDHGHDGGDDN